MKRVMYIEDKSGGLDGPGRIGWVEFSKSRRSYHYAGRTLLRCAGYKYNCIDVETQEQFWVSGPKRDGSDKLYGGKVEIDDDARVEYWTSVRGKLECAHLQSYRA
ncbi:MAG: 1-deoxy-D-xylulose-5-phosphate synthase [Planctomycetes bacterium]|nr:1-deoxy-D-xylulose-5-phosphate synthase [Planctomycetota bacterium]